jgi:hypothetical protein
MTALASLELANKDRIKAGPHWRVTIRPATFNPVLLSSPDACWDAVITRQVRVPGGHTYPEADIWPGREEGPDWVAFDAGWSYWRYYQSGLFVHVFTFAEDDPEHLASTIERARSFDGYKDLIDDSTRFADPANLLRTVTMVYVFAARLAAHGLLDAAGSIEITLDHVCGRRLFAERFPVPQQVPRFCLEKDRVTEQRTVDVVELLGSPLRLTREHAMRLFTAFGWPAPDGWMREFQQQAFPDRSADS